MQPRRLNKFVKMQLLEILSNPNSQVDIVGGKDFYVITVKVKTQIAFEYKYTKDVAAVYVGEECIAVDPFKSEDVLDLQKALLDRIEKDKITKQIEQDRKNMRDFDLRAVEFLKNKIR